ncbi:MAG: 3-methylornithine--L-lysine ligase PylC [Thermoleophilia bacterium]|nr:3-methylornithine--L-lysine ligase PylC [Thermoleophilia bacterium]
MRLAVVGGRLQGIEAAYLAGEAGYQVVLLDRDPAVPATGLAAETHVLDVTADECATRAVLETCDAVLPACENVKTLRWLHDRLGAWDMPFAFHLPSYELSSSKLRSDRLFAELGVPRPLPWPECGLPAVVKPSGSSGSEGVHRAGDHQELERARQTLEAAGHEVVVQECVDGPSLSLEVMADGRRVLPLLPALLEFDAAFDCKRVVAPVEAPAALLDSLDKAGRLIAEGLALWGLMDVEAMVRGFEPKVIEIDARLPSQTPTCVYQACGVNMVELLCRLVLEGNLPPVQLVAARACVYQHVRVAGGEAQVLGEHVMADTRPLALWEGFFGADVALTDYAPSRARWAATLITLGRDVPEARQKADEVVLRLARDCALTLLAESIPLQESLR